MVTHTVGTGRVRALRRDDDRPLLSGMVVEEGFAKGSPDSMALVVSPRPPLAVLALVLVLVLALVAVRVVKQEEEEEDKEEATEDPVAPRASPASLPPAFLRPSEGRAKPLALAWEELESGRPKVPPATGLPGWPLAACPGGNAWQGVPGSTMGGVGEEGGRCVALEAMGVGASPAPKPPNMCWWTPLALLATAAPDVGDADHAGQVTPAGWATPTSPSAGVTGCVEGEGEGEGEGAAGGAGLPLGLVAVWVWGSAAADRGGEGCIA